jgi:hypothetical protein
LEPFPKESQDHFRLKETHRDLLSTVNMAKRKRNNASTHAVKKQATTGLPSPPHENDAALGATSIHAVISPEEMEIAVETLQSLTEHPALIKSKACKDLRAAVYNFRQASTTGMAAAGTLKH